MQFYIFSLKIEFLYRQVEFCIACFCNMRMASMQYVNGIHAICEWKLCNMRIALIPFARGMLSVVERNQFLLREEFSFTVNSYLIITFRRTNAILSHDLLPATNSFPNKFRIPATLSLSDTGILILTCPVSLSSSTIESTNF